MQSYKSEAVDFLLIDAFAIATTTTVSAGTAVHGLATNIEFDRLLLLR